MPDFPCLHCSIGSIKLSQPLYWLIGLFWLIGFSACSFWSQASVLMNITLYVGFSPFWCKIDRFSLILHLKGIRVWIVRHLPSSRLCFRAGYWVDDDDFLVEHNMKKLLKPELGEIYQIGIRSNHATINGRKNHNLVLVKQTSWIMIDQVC